MKPYGYVRKDGEGVFIYGEHQFQNVTGAELVPVYLHPKEWVGLTDDEIKAFDTWHDNREEEVGWCNPSEIVAYIDAKLKEKNT